MVRKHKGSTLNNGKEGLFPKEVIDFDLTDADLVCQVLADSELRYRQIGSLFDKKPALFDESNNLVWDTIVVAAQIQSLTLSPEILQNIYSVHGIELSVNNVCKHLAHEKGNIVLHVLGDAIGFYLDACYKRYIEESLPQEVFEFVLEGFLIGSELLMANYEPLISAASKLTTTNANLKNRELAEYKKKRALELKLEYEKAHPDRKLTDSWIASRAAKKLEAELNKDVAPGEKRQVVSPKTLKNYYANANNPT